MGSQGNASAEGSSLIDVITGLKVLSGQSPVPPLLSDINGDNRLGMAEVISALQELSAPPTDNGWFAASGIADPVLGDDTQWFASAIGSQASFDNVRLMSLVV